MTVTIPERFAELDELKQQFDSGELDSEAVLSRLDELLVTTENQMWLAQLHNFRAKIYASNDRWEEAVDQLMAGLQKAPLDERFLRGRMMVNLAVLGWHQLNMELAKEFASHACEELRGYHGSPCFDRATLLLAEIEAHELWLAGVGQKPAMANMTVRHFTRVASRLNYGPLGSWLE